MYALGAGSRAKRKFGEVKRLCAKHTIVHLQETHGCIGDLQTLEREVGSHRAFGSFDSSPGVGGVVILVAKQLVSQAAIAICSTIHAARCIELTIAFRSTTLQLINVHVDPAADHNTKEALYRDIASSMVERSEGICFLGVTLITKCWGSTG